MPLELFDGPPVKVSYSADLRDTAGGAAWAATSIRKRDMALDPELKSKPRVYRRILLHEYFHFAWVRLGNPLRLEWEEFLKSELRSHARGETGWSAEWRKKKLSARDVAGRSRLWRDYCCESFCDTGALVYGKRIDQSEITLSRTRRKARAEWFHKTFPTRTFAI